MVVLLCVASLAAGRVWRFPFDDELSAMAFEPHPGRVPSAWELTWYFLNSGIFHPPLSFLLFSSLYKFGVAEPVIRLLSLMMTALALSLWHILALAVIGTRRDAPVEVTSRMAAVLIFGLSPLAIGIGDAIRWYPPFALSVALFATLYLAGTRNGARLASAVPLGLAASINLIAPLVIAPFVLYRYVLERAWRTAFDLCYWVIFLLAAAPGLYTAVSVVRFGLRKVRLNAFGLGPVSGLAENALGFFGGTVIGPGWAWVVIPSATVAVFAVATQIDRRRPADPVHFMLLLLAAPVPAVLAGFAESRAYLYLAPIFAAVLTAYLGRRAWRESRRYLLCVCCVLMPGLVVIGELRAGTHPFKRNNAIPFDAVLAFIDGNKTGDALVLSTDPVVPWELQKRADPHLCAVSFFDDNTRCAADAHHYDAVFVISGHSAYSVGGRGMQQFAAHAADITAGREKIAELHVGHDEDAMLKTRLTGVPLDEFILTVDLYR